MYLKAVINIKYFSESRLMFRDETFWKLFWRNEPDKTFGGRICENTKYKCFDIPAVVAERLRASSFQIQVENSLEGPKVRIPLGAIFFNPIEQVQ